MKKRTQVVPISSDDHSALSADTTTKSTSTRSRIRLRNSSSKFNKRQQQLGLFGKRPYLYKAADQSASTSRFNILCPNGNIRNGNNNKNGNNNGNNTDDQLTTNIPVHWIDWFDSGMEFFGCGIATGADITVSSEDENQHSSSPFKHGPGNVHGYAQSQSQSQSLHNLQREQDILAIKQRHLELMERDYVQLHEDFFDSLLKEEGDQMLASIAGATISLQRNGSASFSVGSATDSGFTTTTEANRTVNLNVQNSCDSISASNQSVSSTGAVRLNRKTSLGKNSRKTTKGTNFDVYDEQFNTNTATSTSTTTAAATTTTTTTSNNAKSEYASVPSSGSANASASASANRKQKQSSSSILSIRDIMAKTHLESPSLYLHTKCKLQKDKGKGDRLGSAISARGSELTLAKLRDKMKLIVEVSGELQAASLSNKSNIASIAPPSSAASASISSGSSNGFKVMSAGMKRRRAKVSLIEHSDSCINGAEDGSYIMETRSMIELQLGFLSMQYGLLLRWDAYRTGQIVFVCLRKMCHDSFYTKIRSPPRISTTTSITASASMASRSMSEVSSSKHPHRKQPIMKERSQSQPQSQPQQPQKDENETGLGRPPRIVAATKKRTVTPPLVVRTPKGGNHAIYQRSSGATEVVLVDAPYRVPHPDVFAPSVLSLDVHRLTGLNPKSRWTLIMTFDGDTEIAHLKYNHRERVFETTRTAPCKWEISMTPNRSTTVTSFDLATGLEIRLFEQRPKQRLRGVANGVAGMVGVKSSSSASSSFHVPPGSDPFSLTSPSNSYVIQNQRLFHYTSGNTRRMHRVSSEISLGSFNSGASGSTGGSSSGMHSSKKSTSRLASTMTVPLGGLICQPSTSQTTLWKLTLPFTHDEDAEVTLTLMHQSDYAHWLYQELRARRKEELALSSSSPSSADIWRLLVATRNSKATTSDDEKQDDGNDDDEDTRTDDSDDTDVYFMEWLYYCCVDPR
jgi:hypothetical protein